MQFDQWCKKTKVEVDSHTISKLVGDPNLLDIGINEIADAIPKHYASDERLAHIFRRLGKSQAAEYLEEKLPTTQKARSGDLGEILATEFISSQSDFQVPIKRFRWKDHRNMAMRGEDVIGIYLEPKTGNCFFLKAEVKSRIVLKTSVVKEAREALDKDGGLPSAHALSFIADRLAELGNNELSDAINDAQLKHGIYAKNVYHLLFTFSGNDPDNFLSTSVKNYKGDVIQRYVGLLITNHKEFVASVYRQVSQNANN